MSDTRYYDWRDDGVVGGHARYCVEPSHSTMYYCAASPEEPATMLGGRSEAFKRDHDGDRGERP